MPSVLADHHWGPMPRCLAGGPIESGRPNVMEAAQKQLPGLTFDTVYKLKIRGKDSHEVRGKDKRGKIRKVEVSAKGEVIAIE
jgi:hypothetical protein